MPSFAVSASQLLRRQAESVIHMARLSARQNNTASSIIKAPRARFSTQRGAARRGPKASSSVFQQQRTFFQQRFSSTTNNTTTKTQSQSLSQRLKTLSREYGWSALGVYLALSALDFPFCFATVRLVGVERIGYMEHAILDWIKGALGHFWPMEIESAHKEPEQGAVDEHGVIEAERRNVEEGASIWTQLALAYAIHKSFIFLRVPLTAAVTPKVVQTLRRWGWNIGKRAPKGN
ncbi:hypothetical protein PISL3812_02588 [Talaromyces islandicus]|uniref:DUF1279 domain-containing protein n=1 Tax=Talaromyces islandicus TaxID=28573 RepID=A0A0U1LQA4_TALIS|nr:hypothetical protein PISL3812_02588 [Talaromyces islandicus]